MESVIEIYFYPKVSKVENFPTANFRTEFTNDWFKEPYVQFCLENIDKCKWMERDVVRSPVLGLVTVDTLSGAFKTLTMACHLKGLKFPLRNLGDNCAEAVYRAAIDGNTCWNYEGYMSDVLPEQSCYFPELDARVLGSDVRWWLIVDTPDEFNPVERRRRRYEEIIRIEKENGTYIPGT